MIIITYIRIAIHIIIIIINGIITLIIITWWSISKVF